MFARRSLLTFFLAAAPLAAQANPNAGPAPPDIVDVVTGVIWMKVALTVSTALLVIGGLFLRFYVRTNRTNPWDDPWIKAKLEGEPTPGTLTQMDPMYRDIRDPAK